MAAPSLKNVLAHGAAMIGFYHAAQELADAFSMCYGEDIHQRMIEALRIMPWAEAEEI